MKCQEYIYRHTCGQWEQSTRMDRFWMTQHRMMCRRCATFTRNDTQLDQILQGYRQHLWMPMEMPDVLTSPKNPLTP
jgi:hypothetical protein